MNNRQPMSSKPDKGVSDLWQRIYPQLVEILGEPEGGRLLPKSLKPPGK